VERLTLLEQADQAGLVVYRDGDNLIVRGPRRAAVLARLLLDNKAAVVDELRRRERGRQHDDGREWDADEAVLLRWYAANRDLVPDVPFKLGAGLTVVSRATFLTALDRDVRDGAGGPRAAGLIHELTLLRSLMGGRRR
jgi:hypothetical protein